MFKESVASLQTEVGLTKIKKVKELTQLAESGNTRPSLTSSNLSSDII